MQYLRIKNYDKYQHYKDRNPPWIKLYRGILHDYDLRSVPVPSRLAYVYLLIIASETDNRIPHDHKFLSDRFGFDVNELTLTPLIHAGFLLASGARRVLAPIKTPSSLLCLGVSSLHSLPSDSEFMSKDCAVDQAVCVVLDFDTFWAAYPKKVGKKTAFKAWHAAKDRPHITLILNALDFQKRSEAWTKDHGQFIPHPATWINAGRWSDEPTERPPSLMEAFLSRQPYKKDPL